MNSLVEPSCALKSFGRELNHAPYLIEEHLANLPYLLYYSLL